MTDQCTLEHSEEARLRPVVFLKDTSGTIEIQPASQLLPCTPWELPKQCAWCGLMQSGAFAGKIVLHHTPLGLRPFLCPGYSHGICKECSCSFKRRHRLHALEEQHGQALLDIQYSLALHEHMGACA